MPIYEYHCEHCSCYFEIKRGFHESSVVKCPQCQKRAKRVFSPVPIIFKGSGFYVTDHKATNSNTSGEKRNGDKPADTSGKVDLPKENKGVTAS